MENLIVRLEEGIGEIVINRPKALNALNKQTLEELEATVAAFSKDKEVKVVIITGAGEKSFVAGADIVEMKQMNALQGREWAAYGQKVFSNIENMPQVTIAAINGYALGGGCELSMACDLRLASKNARFGQPEIGLGITPGFAGTQRLPRLVGKALAKELIFTTNVISAEEAYRIHLINQICEQEELMPRARELACTIMSKGTYAVSLAKKAINSGMNMDTESAYSYEADIFGLCFATEDQKEGMEAFVEKRKPCFKGC